MKNQAIRDAVEKSILFELEFFDSVKHLYKSKAGYVQANRDSICHDAVRRYLTANQDDVWHKFKYHTERTLKRHKGLFKQAKNAFNDVIKFVTHRQSIKD